jgi:hypothetical protein
LYNLKGNMKPLTQPFVTPEQKAMLAQSQALHLQIEAIRGRRAKAREAVALCDAQLEELYKQLSSVRHPPKED